MILGKNFVVWATLFVIGLVFSDGSGQDVPNDPVFDCLWTSSDQAYQCHASAHKILNSHRGGLLGGALRRKLLPRNYGTWPELNTTDRAGQCMTALKNFVEPLKVVVQSETGTKFRCSSSSHTLTKTLRGLLRDLENSIKEIDRYVRVHHITLDPLRVKHVNMTRMASLASRQMPGLTPSQAVQLRNSVLLDYLQQVVLDIKSTAGSCFNTISINFPCSI